MGGISDSEMGDETISEIENGLVAKTVRGGS